MRRPTRLLAPGLLWLTVFFLVPILMLAAYSLMPRGIYGGVEPGVTLSHYARFLDPLYLRILARTSRDRGALASGRLSWLWLWLDIYS